MHRSHTELFVHFVWSTHMRQRIIEPSWEKRLYEILAHKCIDLRSPAIRINGTEDHVHILMRVSARLSIADLVQGLKGSSSCVINKEKLAATQFRWQDGYGAFSVSPGRGVNATAHYIDNQKHHHTSSTSISEWEQCEAPAEAGEALPHRAAREGFSK